MTWTAQNKAALREAWSTSGIRQPTEAEWASLEENANKDSERDSGKGPNSSQTVRAWRKGNGWGQPPGRC